ncbi:MAG: TIGR03936 family radical SAM-associated protein [Peptostreptococcales bacterium]
MNRYLIKYTKTDNMKYISHLDLMNVLLRAFKRAKIDLAYSQGFSPHPKISTAHPLSLGIESIGEYLEVELQVDLLPDAIASAMKHQLPRGIELTEIKKVTEPMKSIASIVEVSGYLISFYNDSLTADELREKIASYLSLDEIQMIKISPKTKKEKVLDIKPLIYQIDVLDHTDEENYFLLSVLLKTGSNGNLNPMALMENISDKCSLNIDRDRLSIMRKEMYGIKEEKRVRLIDII